MDTPEGYEALPPEAAPGPPVGGPAAPVTLTVTLSSDDSSSAPEVGMFGGGGSGMPGLVAIPGTPAAAPGSVLGTPLRVGVPNPLVLTPPLGRLSSPIRKTGESEADFEKRRDELLAEERDFLALYGEIRQLPPIDPATITGFTNLDTKYGELRAAFQANRRAAKYQPVIPRWARPPQWRPNEDTEAYKKRSSTQFYVAWSLLDALMMKYKVRPIQPEYIRDMRYDELHAAILTFIAYVKEGGAVPVILGPDVTYTEAREIGSRDYALPLLGEDPMGVMGVTPWDYDIRRDEMVEKAKAAFGGVPGNDYVLERSEGPPQGSSPPPEPQGTPKLGEFDSELGPQFDPELHKAISVPGLKDFGGSPKYDMTNPDTEEQIAGLWKKYSDRDPVTPAENAEYAYLEKMNAWMTTPAGWDRLLEMGKISFPDYQEKVQLPRGANGEQVEVPVMGKMFVPAVGAGRNQLEDDRRRVEDDDNAAYAYPRAKEVERGVDERDWRVTSMHHSEPWWLEEPGNPNRPDVARAEDLVGNRGVLPAYKEASYDNAVKSGSDFTEFKLRFTSDPDTPSDRDHTREPNPETEAAAKGMLLYGSGNYRFEDLDNWTAPPWSTKEATGDTDKAPAWNVPADILEFLDSIDNSPKDERLFPMAMGFVKDVPKVEGWGDNVFGLDELRANLETNIIEPQEHPELFSGLIQPSRTTLMYGPAGTGKTTVATKVAAMAGGLFAHVVPSRLLGGYISSAAKIIELLYQGLKKSGRPCIVFFDECEKLIGSRTGGNRSEQLDQVVQALLVWTDEDQVKAPIYTIYATNIPQNVEAAILSRISLKVPVWLPGKVDRKHFLGKFFANAVSEQLAFSSVKQEAFVEEMAEITKWRSFRTIKLTLRSALKVNITAFLHRRRRDGRKGPIRREEIAKLTQEDFAKALRDTTSSEPECERLMEWALKTKTPMSKMLPLDYQYKEDFGAQ